MCMDRSGDFKGRWRWYLNEGNGNGYEIGEISWRLGILTNV